MVIFDLIKMARHWFREKTLFLERFSQTPIQFTAKTKVNAHTVKSKRQTQ
jgi:hypothetical protein